MTADITAKTVYIPYNSSAKGSNLSDEGYSEYIKAFVNGNDCARYGKGNYAYKFYNKYYGTFHKIIPPLSRNIYCLFI